MTQVDILAAAISDLQTENRVLRAQLATVSAGIVRPDEIREMVRTIVDAAFEERRPRRVVDDSGNVRVLRVAL